MKTLRLNWLVVAAALIVVASPLARAANVKLGDSGITLTVETKEVEWGKEIAVKLSKPLEGKALLAFAKPTSSLKYADTGWVALKQFLTTQTESVPKDSVKFVVPEVPSDLYRLRFVLEERDANSAEARAVDGTQAGEVTIPIVHPSGSVTVLMEAFRNIFLEGERPRVNIVTKNTGEVKGPIVLTLSGPAGDSLAATRKIKGTLASGKHTHTFTLDTSALRPGNYTLSAKVGDIPSRPVKFEIAPRTRPTDFVIHEWTWGGGGPRGNATKYIDAIADAHLNLVGSIQGGQNYGFRSDKNLAKQYAQNPRLPAAEAANRLGRGSLNMEHMLRRGISYLQEPPYFSALFRALYH
ncbi:MAG: hypothetical protein QGD94_09345, partial [Planctomycetia bacterium]|nr:hypothetical protein [Planctomycetia bacterium]